MSFIVNFPFFTIILAMFSGIVSSVLDGRWAKRVCIAMLSIVLVLSSCVLFYTLKTGESFTYMMGHFPAPWGNEIRAGILEGFMATFFTLIMILSVLSGLGRINSDVEPTKINMFFVLTDMLMSSLLAMIYTNDLFTGYVFVEINTIATCGMIMIRQSGHRIVAAIRYFVLSQIGSGLFLIGISLLYDITGQLLMVPAREQVERIIETGSYMIPFLLVVGLISIGLGIKSGLYPFHSWIPDTYGYATPAASAILSSLVSKGYIILLIKIYFRVFGFENVLNTHIPDILFGFGIIAMIMGSVDAIRQKDARRMIACSSVAQIGYIYMGIGLGTHAGMVAATFHILTHAATKSMLFLSVASLYEAVGGKTDLYSLRGAGYKNKLAGVAFLVGSLSMVGFPMLSGFVSKAFFASAALESPGKMVFTLGALVISTTLNAVYFLRLVVNIYALPQKGEIHRGHFFLEQRSPYTRTNSVVSILLIALNLFLGMFSPQVVMVIERGLEMF